MLARLLSGPCLATSYQREQCRRSSSTGFVRRPASVSMSSCRRPGVCASYVKVPAGAVFAHGAASCVFPPCSGNLVCSAGVALNPDAQTRSHRPGDSIMRVTASRLRRRSMSKLASGMVRMTRNYSGTLLPDIQRCLHVVSQRLIHVQALVRQSNRNRTSSSIASQAANRTRHRIQIHITTTISNSNHGLYHQSPTVQWMRHPSSGSRP